MQHFRVIALLALLPLLLCSCKGTSFRSSVPAYPVRVVIDTRQGPYVHFQPTSMGEYITVTDKGYDYGSYHAPLLVTDAYGYGGVVVYVSAFGYVAFDMACPECAAHGMCQSCEIDGIYARCPECGEEYDLSVGTAAPQHGIAHEMMRRLNLLDSDGKLTVSQQR